MTDAVGLPGTFDEGAKFFDWNNDGRLDLLIHHPEDGPTLWEFDGTHFVQRDVLPHYKFEDAYGLNIGDLNGDGLEDLLLAGGTPRTPTILLNAGDRFERNPISLVDLVPYQLTSIADFDRDGRLDVYLTDGFGVRIRARNITPSATRETITIDVVNAAGRHNHFGRVVQLKPELAPSVTFTRVVDGGSGLLSQRSYAITLPTTYRGTHHVSVRFASGTITFDAKPGQRIRVFENGQTQVY